jgi:hydrogenase maturation protease
MAGCWTACAATERYTLSVTRVVVFGYGNPLRGDDGAGWRVAEAFGANRSGHVLVRKGLQPLPEWAADLREVDVAYFVDASVSTTEPGLECLALAPETTYFDTHDMDPMHVLSLTRVAYGRAPRAYVVHVPAMEFDFSESLSPVACAGVCAAVRLLDDHISHLDR